MEVDQPSYSSRTIDPYPCTCFDIDSLVFTTETTPCGLGNRRREKRREEGGGGGGGGGGRRVSDEVPLVS